MESATGDVFERIPKDLYTVSVDSLDVTRRVENALKAGDLESIGDICALGRVGLLRVPNLGSKSLSNLVEALEIYLERAGSKEPARQSEKKSNKEHDEGGGSLGVEIPVVAVAKSGSTLHLAISTFLSDLSERNAVVVRERLGFDGAPKTLQDIGNRTGLTRERVRQIAAAAVRRAKKTGGWPSEMSTRLSILLTNRPDPLYLAMIEAEDPWFAGFSGQSSFLAEIINEFSEPPLFGFKIQSMYVVSKASHDDVAEARREIANRISDILPSKPTRFQVLALVEAVMIQIDGGDLSQIAFQLIEPSLHFITDDSGKGEYLASVGRTVVAAVRAVMEATEEPLHYSEIAVRAAEVLGDSVDERTVHNSLKHVGGILLGRGKYGLWKHAGISESASEEIAEACEEIVQSDSARQWHVDELMELISSECVGSVDDLDRYKLGAILHRSNQLRSLGRGVWQANTAMAAADDGARIDIQQACISLLRQNGSPMKATLLKERLREFRGIGGYCQLHAGGEMIRLGPSLWGLLSRDVGIDESQVERGLAELADYLEEVQTGIHEDEIEAVFRSRNGSFGVARYPTVWYSLAAADSRFIVGQGALLGLRKWGDVRRMTITTAIRKAVERSSEPQSTEEMRSAAERLAGRKIDVVAIRAGLQTLPIEYDPGIRKWRKTQDDID